MIPTMATIPARRLLLALSARPPLTSTSAFVAAAPAFPAVQRLRAASNRQFTTKANADDNADDDWFADYNPADYTNNPETTTTTTTSRSRDTHRSTSTRDRNSSSRGGSASTRGDDGGSHSHSHHYSRDTSNGDLTAVNEDAVNTLLDERLQAKQKGDYDRADAIQEELVKDHGVSVWEEDRIWRTGPAAVKPRNKNSNNNNKNKRDRAQHQRDFGPNGHDYSLSREAGNESESESTTHLTLAEIHELLAERLQCKMARNFKEADAIKDDLKRAGVHVHDGRKEWRADGVPFL
jgi:cysteinyl-tRNA synthetase